MPIYNNDTTYEAKRMVNAPVVCVWYAQMRKLCKEAI